MPTADRFEVTQLSKLTRIFRRLECCAQVALHGLPPAKENSSRYAFLLKTAKELAPRTMVEIGTWRGDRSERFISEIPTLQYFVGFDLFENMDSEVFARESMGHCFPVGQQEVEERLARCQRSSRCEIELVRGPTEVTLPSFARDHEQQFDFVYIDGGHSLETVANDWEYGVKLASPTGTLILDDYYLNDDSRGVKPLVDGLLSNPGYSITFFPMIETIIEGLQITMVSIRKTPIKGPRDA
jgi:predicted O-methyltransferase YrrM